MSERPQENEIVQIAPPHKWAGCLGVVSEDKGWGVMLYVSIPHNDGQPPGQAFIRIKDGEYERIGASAIFVPGPAQGEAP